MILMLLICSSSYLKAQQTNSSSTGNQVKTDTTKVLISIDYLRDANAKLIERLFLIKVKSQQDSIINLNKLYITEQDNIIKSFQTKVVTLTENNNKYLKTIEKQKQTNNILKVLQ